MLRHVANQPEVISGIAPGYEQLDCRRFFDNSDNVMLGDERGLALFFSRGGGVYEAHYLFTKVMRGRDAFLRCKAALKFMFTRHAASLICGSTPRENRAARAMNRVLGAQPVGVSVGKSGGAYIRYALRRDDFERRFGEPIRHQLCE